ncbi:aldo/keto reductase [Corynebacterium suranareeae]|uniref:Aldo/keto reductase n=1 Tax=Corynebacterium suranareeae TaxID=2506452 RepID=A0A169S585_9CORY|nr:aldo/keto reductase [Corynebacterium suranareeae]BAU97159.1 aldo/keto reductase [Corynebacterium suranareeae]
MSLPALSVPLVLGGNTFGWTSDQETSFAVLDAFVAAGGTYIDTADLYASWAGDGTGGDSEKVLGEWFKARGNRDKVVLATKMGGLAPYNNQQHDTVVAALEESLKRLQTDYIDIYYSHYDDENVAIADQAKTYHSLVESGKVRHIALSNYSPERIREWFEYATANNLTLPAAIQPQYNLVHRSDFEKSYLPLAREYGAATFPYFALASGFLSGTYRTPADLEGRNRQGFVEGYATPEGFAVVDALVELAEKRNVEPSTVALAWQLAKGVTAPIASVSTPAQLPALLAIADVKLSDAEVAALDEASKSFA